MLVVAGAGTGKTSVLIHRIANLVQQGHARPDQILALTYTVEAAQQMQDRATALLGAEIRSATFHDFCLDILKRANQAFGVLDDKDLWIYLRKRIHELHLEHYVRAANIPKFLTDLLDFLSRCHDELVTPEKYADYLARLRTGEYSAPRVTKSKDKDDLSDEEIIARCEEISRVFSTSERWLREENYGTFGHMLTGAHAVLTTDANVLAAEQSRARFILVDEFQDANYAQIEILARLAGPEANVFAVGDPDQAIYRFRGASSAAFQLFRRHFPATKLVVLGKNRRSTSPILQSAFAIIDKNPPVFQSQSRQSAPPDPLSYRRTPLQSAREEDAQNEGHTLPNYPVEAIVFSGKEAEAPDVVAIIEETKRKARCRWKDFGILYRSHTHRDEIVHSLAERDIPFSIEKMDVSDTAEVRDLFACIASVVDLGSDAALFRVAALPQFNVDPEQLRATVRAIAKDSRDGVVVPLSAVLDTVAGGAEVLQCVRRSRDEVAQKKLHTHAALCLIGKNFGLNLSTPVLQAALKFAADWEQKCTTKTKDLNEWIEYLNYFREAGGAIPLASNDNDDAVRLMTAHGVKGLEFAHVCILRASKGSFPTYYRETLVEFPRELRDPDSASASDDKTLSDQEERRLFYVAMTRAKDSLHIYGKQGMGRDKTPTGFMRELIGNPTLKSWLRFRDALPSQPELIDFIAASAADAQPQSSRLPAWLALPPVEGLHARLSASAVETYKRCPLQFKFEREWKLSREVHGALQYGAAMHRVLKTYYDSVRLGRAKTDDELLQLFRDDIAAAGMQDGYQRDLYLEQGIEQLKEFLAGTHTTPRPEVLHTEEWFDIEIAGTKVAGRIDRIDRLPDGTVAIVDYKTGKARSQEDADDSLQLSIYAMAAQQKWGYRVGELTFHNLEGNVAVVSKRTEFQLEEVREDVQEVARNIAGGNFKAKIDYHCNFCAFRGLCPAREKCAPDVV